MNARHIGVATALGMLMTAGLASAQSTANYQAPTGGGNYTVSAGSATGAGYGATGAGSTTDTGATMNPNTTPGTGAGTGSNYTGVGVPNTGAGGSAAENTLILGSAAAIAILGGAYLARRRVA